MPALVLIGALLLAGALALGGGSALLVWPLSSLARVPLQVAAVAALYLAPGLALLRLLWPRARALPASAHVALALCLSAALPPLLLLAAHAAGLRWGGGATWGYLLVSLLLCFAAAIRDGRSRRRTPISWGGAALALLGVALAALLVRLYAVRDLRVGLLGDSYHHTLIVQLLLDNGGLFQSWRPYAPLATFTYHFGFHANAAFIHYVTGADAPRSVLWAGQILNALAAPAVFALAVGLGGAARAGEPRRWAGVWAALIVGFVSNIPAFFVNWGRYTQLSGQIALMAAVVCWAALAETTDDRPPTTYDDSSVRQRGGWWSAVGRRWSLDEWRLLVLTAVVTAGLLLTHYLVTALASLFVASYLLAFVLARRSWRVAGALALRAALAGGLALLLTAPWLLTLARGHLVRNANGLVGGGAGQAVVAQISALEPVVPRYVSGAAMLGALLGLLIAAWRRDWRAALPAAWCALLVLALAPQVAGLPGTGVIDSVTALGTLFIPTALLAGYALAEAQAWASRAVSNDEGRTTANETSAVARSRWLIRRSSLVDMLAGALLLVLIAVLAGPQARMASGETALVADADLAAIEWVRVNTPADAKFLINSFPAYGGSLAAGTDAGWWLPLLAGREVNLPPLTYGGERGERDDYDRGVNALVKKIRGKPLTDSAPLKIDLTRPVALKALADNRFDYVYSGAHPFPGPNAADRFDTAKMRASPAFRLVYERDGVEIFQFVGS